MALTGMNRHTGKPLTGLAHVRQSVADILSTVPSSRRMRPAYGSQLPRMVDMPGHPGWVAAVQAEAARVLARWEPRIALKRVRLVSLLDGRYGFIVECSYLGEARVLEIEA